jgi:hypothetical protein
MDNDRTIILEKHILDAWGLWYLEWQATKKDIIKKQAQSPKEFINKLNQLVSIESSSPRGHTATSLVLPSK